MDDSRFENLLRVLTASLSRRSALRALGALALGGGAATSFKFEEAEAKTCGECKKKKGGRCKKVKDGTFAVPAPARMGVAAALQFDDCLCVRRERERRAGLPGRTCVCAGPEHPPLPGFPMDLWGVLRYLLWRTGLLRLTSRRPVSLPLHALSRGVRADVHSEKCASRATRRAAVPGRTAAAKATSPARQRPGGVQLPADRPVRYLSATTPLLGNLSASSGPRQGRRPC